MTFLFLEVWWPPRFYFQIVMSFTLIYSPAKESDNRGEYTIFRWWYHHFWWCHPPAYCDVSNSDSSVSFKPYFYTASSGIFNLILYTGSWNLTEWSILTKISLLHWREDSKVISILGNYHWGIDEFLDKCIWHPFVRDQASFDPLHADFFLEEWRLKPCEVGKFTCFTSKPLHKEVSDTTNVNEFFFSGSGHQCSGGLLSLLFPGIHPSCN